MATFERSQILERLRARIAAGAPVVAAGCSAGLIAKCAEQAGADLIVVYSTGRSRLMGLPTTQLGDSNSQTMDMYREIANVVDVTPIIGGADAADPQYRRIGELVDAFHAAGFDGLINFPSLGERPDFARMREAVGFGLDRESQLVGVAKQRDIFTMGYAYSRDQARRLAEAGVDVLIPHAGWTTGGLQGAGESARTLAQSAAHVQDLIELAWSIDPGIICLAHGGSISEPEDTAYLYEHTDAQGFVGASSIERTPVERAVMSQVRAFREQRLRPSGVPASPLPELDTGNEYNLN